MKHYQFWAILQWGRHSVLQLLFLDFRRGSTVGVFAHIPLHTPETALNQSFNRKIIKSRNCFLFLVVDWLYMPKNLYGISYTILTYRADLVSL